MISISFRKEKSLTFAAANAEEIPFGNGGRYIFYAAAVGLNELKVDCAAANYITRQLHSRRESQS